jgi:hypothetical protein
MIVNMGNTALDIYPRISLHLSKRPGLVRGAGHADGRAVLLGVSL